MNKKIVTMISVFVLGMLILPIIAKASADANNQDMTKTSITDAFKKTEWARRHKDKKLDKKDVPSAAISSFEKAYPNAEAVEYVRENEDGKIEYEIRSGKKDSRLEVAYDEKGNLIKTEEIIATDALPEEVKQSLQGNYPKQEIKGAEKVTTAEEIQYEVTLDNGSKRHEIIFDQQGKVVSDTEKHTGGHAGHSGHGK